MRPFCRSPRQLAADVRCARRPGSTEMNMKVARIALLLLALVAVGAAGFFIVTTPPPIGAVDNARLEFPTEQIARGAELALMGDCIVCHTRAGAKAYAGG